MYWKQKSSKICILCSMYFFPWCVGITLIGFRSADDDRSFPHDNDVSAPSDVNIVVVHGETIESSQLNDYAFRGPELMPMIFVDFCVFTTQKRISFDISKISDNLCSVCSFYHPQHPLSGLHYRHITTNGSKFLRAFQVLLLPQQMMTESAQCTFPACNSCSVAWTLGMK